MVNLDLLVKKLLFEDVETRLPELRRQFAEFSDDVIRSLASADPSGDRCIHLTWLLRMLRKGDIAIGDDLEPLTELLTQFMLMRENRKIWKSTSDIGQYKSVEDLKKAVDLAKIEVEKQEQAFKEECVTDQKQIAEHGIYTLYYLPTPAAVVGFCFGSQPMPTKSLAMTITHGTRTPERDASWCTVNYETARTRYLAKGKLFGIREHGEVAYQLFLAKSGSDVASEIHDTQNGTVSAETLKAIAPLFKNDKFAKLFQESQVAPNTSFMPAPSSDEQYTEDRVNALKEKLATIPKYVTSVSLETVTRPLRTAKHDWYTNVLNGYTDKAGRVHAPVSRSRMAEIDAAWLRKSESFRTYIYNLIANKSADYGRYVKSEMPRLRRDIEGRIASLQGKANVRTGVQLLYDYVFENTTGEAKVYNPAEDADVLEAPPVKEFNWIPELTDPEAFRELMADIDAEV